MELSGSGKISLGRPFDQSVEVISYESVLASKD
jgi:hypothetical protein